MSYTTTFYHIIFRTYCSEKTILENHERELYAYIFGIASNLRCQTYRIGGMPDHIHIFVSLPSNLSLASFVQRVKTESSKWLKMNPNFPDFRGWGREYAGFSYNIRDRGMIVGYIMRQKEHHQTVTFAEEYRAFVEENGITVDERYFLQDTE
jgi:REP element-mobilizing transposase RayT